MVGILRCPRTLATEHGGPAKNRPHFCSPPRITRMEKMWQVLLAGPVSDKKEQANCVEHDDANTAHEGEGDAGHGRQAEHARDGAGARFVDPQTCTART